MREPAKRILDGIICFNNGKATLTMGSWRMRAGTDDFKSLLEAIQELLRSKLVIASFGGATLTEQTVGTALENCGNRGVTLESTKTRMQAVH